MDNELEVIRDEMEQTRAKLADKLGALETQVRETVSTASETVTSTVEGVKEVVSSVSETVENVTETFNFSKHIEQNPWVAVGVALAAGFAAGQLLGGSGHPAPQPAPPKPEPQPRHESHTPAPTGPSLATQAAALLPSLESFVPDIAGKAAAAMPSLETMMPELKTLSETVVSGLGGLAVGGVMNIVRELAADALPASWRGEITKIVDDLTQQLGGKPTYGKNQDADTNGQQPAAQGGQQKPEGQPQQGEQANQGTQRSRREARNHLVGQG